MNKFYTLKVAGLERQLPLCPLNDKLSIGVLLCLATWSLPRLAPEIF